MPGTLHVNKIGAATGANVSVETGHSMTFATTQFKLTGGTVGQAITTDGSGNLTFADMTSDPTMGGDLTGTASNAQIAADAVTTGKINSDVVTTRELAAGAVTTTEIAAGEVLAGNIRDNAVETSKINASAVTDIKLAATLDLSSKTVTLPAASVTAHVTAYDDTSLRNDIATLALQSAIISNQAAYNLANAFIDQFEDDTGLDGQTDVGRVGDPEYMSSITTTVEAYHINVNGYGTSTGGSGGHVPTFSTANNARTSFGQSTGSSGFSLNSQTNKHNGIFTIEQTLVQITNHGGSHSYGYGVMKNSNTMSSYTGNTYSAYPAGTHFASTSVVGHKIKTVYDTDTPNVITTYYDSGSGYGSAETGLNAVGANFNSTAITTLYFFMPCWSDNSTPWIWDTTATRSYGTTSATGSFTSTTQTALSTVSNMGIIVLYKEAAGTTTLNTDLVAKISADGGTNYETVTLSPAGTFSTGIKTAVANSVNMPNTGTAPKYKIEFDNQAGPASPHTITVTTNTHTDTSVKKFGTASAQFASGTDALTTSSSSDFSITGDFTIDCWCYFSSINTPIASSLSNEDWGLASTGDWIWIVDGNGWISFQVKGVGSTGSTVAHPTLNEWNHFAVERSGGTTTMYKNGTSIGSSTGPGPGTIGNSGNTLTVGGRAVALVGGYNGYTDEFRFSKGIARYGADFTSPTASYTTDANTQLLLHMDGADSGTTFTDDGGDPGKQTQVHGVALLY